MAPALSVRGAVCLMVRSGFLPAGIDRIERDHVSMAGLRSRSPMPTLRY